MQIEKKHRQLLAITGIFLLAVLMFGVTMVFFVKQPPDEHKEVVEKTVSYIIAIIMAVAVNLANIIFIIPLLIKAKWKKWIANYLSSYLLFLCSAMFIWYVVLLKMFDYRYTVFPFISACIVNTFILMLVEVVFARYDEENTKLENAMLKMSSLQAQHEKLKHQLHPHFLFNSLNALKTLIKRNPQQAESYLIKLSEFLRFSISHNEQNIVSLKEELKFSMYYLEMQKTRFNNTLFYSIEIPDAIINDVQLPVFSLQLLLENAIKHNAMTDECPLHIAIEYVAPGRLLVKNNVTEKMSIHTGPGIGLKNLSERYLLLIQEDIEVIADNENFMVYIKTILP